MFRIAFDPTIGQFIIQFHRWGLIWVTVQEGGQARSFISYSEARAWVNQVGLSEGFDEQPTKGHPFRNGYAPMLGQS